MDLYHSSRRAQRWQRWLCNSCWDWRLYFCEYKHLWQLVSYHKSMDFMYMNMTGSPSVNQNRTFNLQFLNNHERGTVWGVISVWGLPHTVLWQFFVCYFCRQSLEFRCESLPSGSHACHWCPGSVGVTYPYRHFCYQNLEYLYLCSPLYFHSVSCDCGYFAQFHFLYFTFFSWCLYGCSNVPISRYIISIDLHIFGTALMTSNQRDF